MPSRPQAEKSEHVMVGSALSVISQAGSNSQAGKPASRQGLKELCSGFPGFCRRPFLTEFRASLEFSTAKRIDRPEEA